MPERLLFLKLIELAKMSKEETHWSTLDFVFGFKASPETFVALEIIKTHPLIVAIPDGEDTCGRQKLRNMTALETVQRAFDMAGAFVEAARNLGGEEVPTPIEVAELKGKFRRYEFKV